MTEEQYEVFEKWFNKRKYEVQKNGKVRDSGRRPTNPRAILKEWQSLKGILDDYFITDEDEIQDFVETKRNELWPDGNEQDSNGKLTASQLIEVFNNRFDESFEFRIVRSAFILFRRNKLSNQQVKIKTAATETRIMLMEEDLPAPEKELCTNLIEIRLARLNSEMREKALEKIQYDPTAKERIGGFKHWTEQLFRFYGIDEKSQLNRVMWKYFMHSVKRAAFGLIPSENRLFFLIFSRTQGIGKSRLLRHLCDPFPFAFNESVNLSLFGDKTATKAFATSGYALADFQELGLGTGKNSVKASTELGTTMKSIITLDIDKGRELFTTEDTAAMMQTVFASSTNLHISDVVQDEAYRRYFTFNSTLTREESLERDWTEVDRFFDETLIDAYRCLDENSMPSLSVEMAKELRSEQLKYKRRVDLITQWLREEGLEIHDPEDDGKDGCFMMDRTAMYKKFKQFLHSNGYPEYSIGRMQQLIATSMDIMAVDREDGKSYYCVRGTTDAK